ncbi:hypothetical protein HMPREF1991_03071 [Hoylesella loescheii DSM 19665 = JCM 12249 = ATCC 15930]|uniref:Uncharacterized protein n=1 Tax=Hoylesella loescheii DSM 19665 = JCM 12249 = ATCC 15930 TaxID=1122985 RepID=A0A069QFS8_HOYLO|nr:hypothetical protein HMPREF1991_03071 [Hoylesella loescheii DSM 19665 = JCM 12249 = ATCC 15930]
MALQGFTICRATYRIRLFISSLRAFHKNAINEPPKGLPHTQPSVSMPLELSPKYVLVTKSIAQTSPLCKVQTAFLLITMKAPLALMCQL